MDFGDRRKAKAQDRAEDERKILKGREHEANLETGMGLYEHNVFFGRLQKQQP